MISSQDIQKMHNLQAAMLEAFVVVCKKNNLRYFLLGGSVLGAVRHKGIIPWDDDIDIGMPRKDYEEFLRIANKELPDRYEVRNYKTHPEGHIYPYSKVEDNQTSLQVAWLKHLDYTGGVFMDLFPLDGIPRNKWLRNVHYKFITLLRAFVLNQPIKLQTTYTPPSYKKLINYITSSHKFRRMMTIILQRVMSLYSYEKSTFIGNMTGEYGAKEFFQKKIFSDGVNMEFEGNTYVIPKEWNPYLKQLYGENYNEIPPIEKQVLPHDWSLLDLETPNSYSLKKALSN